MPLLCRVPWAQLQWNHVHSPKVGRHTGTTQQWHHVPHHSTLQWHPAMAPRPLPQSWSSPSPPTIQWHPTMAPSNGTTSTAPCNGTLVPRPIRQSGSSPSPLIGSKNPYSCRYLGNTYQNRWKCIRPWFHSMSWLREISMSCNFLFNHRCNHLGLMMGLMQFLINI